MSAHPDQAVAELQAALAAQDRLVRRLAADLDRAEVTLAGAGALRPQIAELEQLLAAVEADAALLTAADLADFDPAAIPALFAVRQAAVAQGRAQTGAAAWPTYVRGCQAALLADGLDPLAPYEALLTPADLRRLRAEAYDAQLRWDAWDYTLVGVSGVLAALTEVLLVGTPQTSPLTIWLKRYHSGAADDWFGRWAQALAETCRVPYDAQAVAGGGRIPGMAGRSHRLQSLGHDPVLGWVVGVLDILRGTVSGFAYEHLQGQHHWVVAPAGTVGQETRLIAALLRHLGHLVSDVATPMGLPAPLLGLFQGINAGHVGDKGRTVGQIARWMYLNGYDLRHFLSGGLGPAVVELVLRGGLLLRHYAEHGATAPPAMAHPKQRAMLLAAHSIAALANAGKVALMQGNPLAINLAQWYALVGYLIPSLRHWLFDAQRLRLAHLERITEPAWAELLTSSAGVLRRAAALDAAVVTLGA